MRTTLRTALLAAIPAMAVAGWAQTDLIPPPANPQHWLSGHMEDQSFIVDQTSDPANNYNPVLMLASLKNTSVRNPYKIVWIHMTLNVIGANFDPRDATNPWVTADAGPGFVSRELQRDHQYSGSSLQFLELWQTIRIEPNPPAEDLRFARILGGQNAPKLMRLDIRTQCVPEPMTLALAGAGLAGAVRRRRRRI